MCHVGKKNGQFLWVKSAVFVFVSLRSCFNFVLQVSLQALKSNWHTRCLILLPTPKHLLWQTLPLKASTQMCPLLRWALRFCFGCALGLDSSLMVFAVSRRLRCQCDTSGWEMWLMVSCPFQSQCTGLTLRFVRKARNNLCRRSTGTVIALEKLIWLKKMRLLNVRKVI